MTTHPSIVLDFDQRGEKIRESSPPIPLLPGACGSSAAAYAAVRDSRLPALLKSGQTDVHFSATVHQSPLLYPSDISTILLLYNVDNFLLQ